MDQRTTLRSWTNLFHGRAPPQNGNWRSLTCCLNAGCATERFAKFALCKPGFASSAFFAQR